MLTITTSGRTWAEINHLKGDDDAHNVWSCPARSSGHGLKWSRAALSCECRKSQINPSYAVQTNATLFHLSSRYTLFQTRQTHAATHTRNQSKSVLSAACPLCAWQQSLNHTIPKSLTRCPSYMSSPSFSLNSFFCATWALWKSHNVFFSIFLSHRLYEESHVKGK